MADSTTTGTITTNLTKLTIPQLKALCKERKITGYSKLSKPGLLLKLGDQIGSTPPSDASAVRVVNTSTSSEAATVATVNEPQIHARVSEPISPNTDSEQRIQPAQSTTSAAQGPSLTQYIPQAQDATLNSTKKRALESLQSTSETPVSKKQKASASAPLEPTVTSQIPKPTSSFKIPELPKPKPKPSISGLVLINKVAALPTQDLVRTPAASLTDSSSPLIPSATKKLALAPHNALSMPRIIDTGHITTKMLPTSKRFKPLIVKKPPPKPHENPRSSPSNTKPPKSNSPVSLYHLDFPLVNIDTMDLKPITLPPKLSQRKYVHRWSIILSALPNAEKGQCCLVSRMFRYAVFLSAARILESKFGGRRWSQLTLKYAANTTNFWPYLRLRELEVDSRTQQFENSFLGRYFKGFRPITRRLWGSPDYDNQLTVAMRFVMSRLWFLISVGQVSAWPGTTVEDAQEIVKSEIWTVTTRTPLPHSSAPNQAKKETFYVLEHTCEVIGHPTAAAYLIEPPQSEPEASGNLRADWSAYIDHRQLPVGAHISPPPPLLASLKWQNQEEHYRGLSKLWIKRIAGEGDVGDVKKAVAERYVLACVVGNSISGRWMSSTQMEQDFASKPDLTPSTMKVKVPQVHLFLPEHHHVESLHFTTADGNPLHNALAIVQTTSREYHILRDNGMQVGTQEDGVSAVWMNVLGCTNLGQSIE